MAKATERTSGRPSEELDQLSDVRTKDCGMTWTRRGRAVARFSMVSRPTFETKARGRTGSADGSAIAAMRKSPAENVARTRSFRQLLSVDVTSPVSKRKIHSSGTANAELSWKSIIWKRKKRFSSRLMEISRRRPRRSRRIARHRREEKNDRATRGHCLLLLPRSFPRAYKLLGDIDRVRRLPRPSISPPTYNETSNEDEGEMECEGEAEAEAKV